MKVLVTRPVVDQDQTLSRLDDLGVAALSSPVMEIVNLDFALPDRDWQAVLSTSRNGLRALSPTQVMSLRPFPFYCVGKKTEDFARELGFEDVRSASSDVRSFQPDLLKSLTFDQGPVLYLTTPHRTGNLGAVLKNAGFEVALFEVYETCSIDFLNDEAVAAIKQRSLDGVLLYSARTARLFLELIDIHDLGSTASTLTYFCLSPAVASILEKRGYLHVVADRPNETSLLACVKKAHNYMLMSGDTNEPPL